MKNRTQIRIIEIMLYRSKLHPRFGHAVATLFPCNHKRNLGLARMKGTEHHYRVNDVKIWVPITYSVAEGVFCKACPEDFGPVELGAAMSDLCDSESGLDLDDDL